jgi:hypothetical protein
MTIRLHPDRYNPSSQVRKYGVVVHDAESGDGPTQALVNLLESPGDRANGSGGLYGSGYHAVTDGTGSYIDMADGTAGPFSAPPCNSDWWHVCMPGFANQTREQWLDPLSYGHIRGVAKFIHDKWIADGQSWGLSFVFADQLAKGIKGYTSHYQVSLAWRKSNHTDPGPNFPWDVLEQEIGKLNNGQEDDEVSNLRFVRNKGYINVFMVGAGPALSVSGEVMNSYPKDTPRIFQNNPQSLKAMCFQSGLDMGDPDELVPGGPEDQF